MTNNLNKSCVPQHLGFDAKESTKSIGRSNCTIFLDHPELLQDSQLRPIDLPADIEFPSCFRRTKVVGL